MPFTPLHFGPSAALGWPFRKHVEWPALILANVAVDIEPLAVWALKLDAPEHGIAHSLAGGTVVAAAWTWAYASAVRVFGRRTCPGKVWLSSLLGVYSNVLLDAVVYSEVRPFYPLTANPLYGLVPSGALTLACGVLTVAWLAVWVAARSAKRKARTAGDAA